MAKSRYKGNQFAEEKEKADELLYTAQIEKKENLPIETRRLIDIGGAVDDAYKPKRRAKKDIYE